MQMPRGPVNGIVRASAPIDSRYFEVCEEDSVRPVGGVGSSLCMIGAYIRDGRIHVEAAALPGQPQPESVTIRLSGIRRGRDGQRFVEHSREDMEHNQQFWDRWKTGGE